MKLRWPSFCSPDVQWRSLKDKVPVYSIEIALIFILLSSYIGFEEAWNQIADASPSWKAQWPQKIYQKIVYVPFFDCWIIISDPSHSRDFVHLPSGSGGVKKTSPCHQFSEIKCWIFWWYRWTVGDLVTIPYFCSTGRFYYARNIRWQTIITKHLGESHVTLQASQVTGD